MLYGIGRFFFLERIIHKRHTNVHRNENYAEWIIVRYLHLLSAISYGATPSYHKALYECFLIWRGRMHQTMNPSS